MDGATIGIIGGVAGALVGLAGGLVGTWASIHATRTQEERRFVWRVSVALWAALGVLLGVPLALVLLGVVPAWLTWVPMTVVFIALGPFIRWANARQAILRGDTGSPPGAPRPTPR